LQKKSYIKNGVLYCFYEIVNYSEVIESALKEHGLEHGKIEIICKPAKDTRCKRGIKPTDHLNDNGGDK
jgi:hypothetical protein